SVAVVSATSITCASPAGSGTVDVTVSSGGSTSPASAADQFTYSGATSAVAVISMTPDFGASQGGTGVVITGTGFTGATSVAFGSVQASGYSVTSDTQIIAIAPPQATGTVAQVAVTSPKGTSTPGSASTFFYVGPPVLAAITPASGNASGGTSSPVTLIGSNFNGTLSVQFGGVEVDPHAFEVVSNSEILITDLPAGTAGTVPVTVTNPAGTSPLSSATNFTYNGIPQPPSVTGVTPNTGSLAGGNDVTITGLNFVPGSIVKFGNAIATNVVVVSNELIAAQSPADFAGQTDITVSTSGGTSSIGSADIFIFTSGAGSGYWLVGSDGGVFALGGLGYYGSTGGLTLNRPIIGIAGTPDSKGYWLVASDGGIFAYGDAATTYALAAGQPFSCPSTGSGCSSLTAPIGGMAITPDGKGYWLFASDGGIFAFGDASTTYALAAGQPLSCPTPGSGCSSLTAPIESMAVTPDGKGYWLVSSKGSVYSFGDANYFGSRGSSVYAPPVLGIAVADSNGYWLVDTAGNVFSYGDAGVYGSVTQALQSQVAGILASSDGNGYWLFERSGAVLPFGDAPNYGSLSGIQLVRPIVGAAT
ncbi:MAG TPA: IPT/TIG domain-containing protein, partial [Acidimicrobiales bacterium]|nr:IPT/TIG domain-containing protein [Acidimicrobiales bacterium]